MTITCVGQLVADIIVRPVSELPLLGRATLVEEIQLVAGGCAANTAAVLSKLGAETKLAALIGRDLLGDAALADLKTSGVQLDPVVRESTAPTTVSIVMINGTGERSFFYRSGGNELLTNRHLPDAVLKASSVVHVGGAMKLVKLDLAQLLTRAKSFGCITSLDTDWDVTGCWLARLQEALPNLNYLFTNQEEATMLTGEESPYRAAQVLLTQGPQVVVIKRGEHGALLTTKADIVEFPGYRVSVRDTTCAGDAFAAGFLLGVSRQWSLTESLLFANAVGALCVTELSHRGITSFEDTRKFIEVHPFS